MVPLRKHAEKMRDMYANEIAAAVHRGEDPSPMQVESWARYDAAARGEDPAAAFWTSQLGRHQEKRTSRCRL